jgi:hypothetical protein
MKISARAFQREFPRMRRLAAAGTVIVVEAEGQAFEFRARRRSGGVHGCMSGRAKLARLLDGPAIPAEEWGELAR